MKSLLICGGVGGAKLAYGFYKSIHHDEWTYKNHKQV